MTGGPDFMPWEKSRAGELSCARPLVRRTLEKRRTAAQPPIQLSRAGVPMYLLIDRLDTRGPMSTLFTEPNDDGTFKHTDAAPSGKPLVLPAPFDVSLPTGEFPGAVAP